MKITKGTIIRTVLLAIALINVGLEMTGNSVIPVNEELISEIVSYGFVVVSAGIAWWKNNSFTKPAIKADENLRKEKKEQKENGGI